MEDYQGSEETAFVVDEVSNIVKEAIESAIGGNAYQHSKVNQWTTNVVEQTLSQLTKLGKPFKYIDTLSAGGWSRTAGKRGHSRPRERPPDCSGAAGRPASVRIRAP
ncbi:dynein light chain Tctex-type 1-like [Octodon degus]|uniref:Dynein light chain Tctex-type 1-like n=1 Tax=Octodon degus TaxID=10160 RepID=A0A6P6DFG8_OCTDE|nr:dynein light chain Tctex-type 1-like [Octodon degus]